jgi:hypothetical protein
VCMFGADFLHPNFQLRIPFAAKKLSKIRHERTSFQASRNKYNESSSRFRIGQYLLCLLNCDCFEMSKICFFLPHSRSLDNVPSLTRSTIPDCAETGTQSRSKLKFLGHELFATTSYRTNSARANGRLYP